MGCVATGNGAAGWMFPTGGGAPTAVGEEWAGHTVAVFEPPRHLAVRAEGDEFTNALEYRIEAAPGGAVLRYVHSGILTGDWDAQYDGASRHTDFYLHSLGEYLGHFAGRTVTYVGASGPGDALEPSAFGAVRAALGLGPDAAVGGASPSTWRVPGGSTPRSTPCRTSSSASAATMRSTASTAAAAWACRCSPGITVRGEIRP